jgi:outer membrane protein
VSVKPRNDRGRMSPAALLAVIVIGTSSSAWAFDPFMTGRSVPASAAGSMLGDGGNSVCVFGSVPDPLPLEEAIERGLCNNPKTREAWANVKIAAAGIGIGRAAYLPTVTGTWQGVRDDTATNVSNYPQYSSDYRNSVLRTESVSLNWVLYDFGGRKAALANASALLAAAKASEEAALEQAFADVAKDYYAAQAAQGAFVASQEIEELSSRVVYGQLDSVRLQAASFC